MMEWIQQNGSMLAWLGLGSAILFVASAIAAPLWIVRLPADYFIRLRQECPLSQNRKPLQLAAMIGRNILGGMLIIAGIGMLVLPGQGLLSIFLGVLLINCPRKYQLVRWMATRPPVWNSINWMRRRAGKKPMLMDPE